MRDLLHDLVTHPLDTRPLVVAEALRVQVHRHLLLGGHHLRVDEVTEVLELVVIVHGLALEVLEGLQGVGGGGVEGEEEMV